MEKICEVIKYEGDNEVFVWKHPKEDFNSLTQLIVHESQEAVFFMNGQALDLLGPGRHTLETQNIPQIGGLLKRTANDTNPFHAEVYFVNKTVQMGIKWGLDTRVQYIDPSSGIPIKIGASGEMNLKVSDSRKILVKLVGTTSGIQWNDENSSNDQFTKSLQNCFKALITTAIKSNLSKTIKEKDFDIIEVDEHLDELSLAVGDKIKNGFKEYGLDIPEFFITRVLLPDKDNPHDPYYDQNFRKLWDLHALSLETRAIQAGAVVKKTQAKAQAEIEKAQREAELERQSTQVEVAKREAERKVISAQADADALRAEGLAKAAVMNAEGYNYKDVLDSEVKKAYAEGLGKMGSGSNSGSGGNGGIANDMLGMMAGLKMAGIAMGEMNNVLGDTFGNKTADNADKNIEKAIQNKETITCNKCGQILPINAQFCFSCGEKIVVVPHGDIVCPSCGKTVPKGKFCLECGQALMLKCTKCGAELPAYGKFCLECGADQRRGE